jgi:hypothetical protein
MKLTEHELARLIIAECGGFPVQEHCGLTNTIAKYVGEERRQAGAAIASLTAELEAARVKIAELEDSAQMACETPKSGCDCAGCSYARESNG